MDVGQSFAAGAQKYDRARRQLIPCFDDFYQSALELAEFPSDAPLDVLDLGAGTGLMSAFFSKRLPRARFTLIDLAEEMLERARTRFDDVIDRFSFVQSDLTDIAPKPGDWDLVISGLAIHHLDDSAKRTLISRVHSALKPGGVFINADQVLGRTPAATERNRRAWLAGARRLDVSNDDLDSAIERMKHDRMATLEDQLRWLEDVGFIDVDCAYKSGMFAVYSGRR